MRHHDLIEATFKVAFCLVRDCVTENRILHSISGSLTFTDKQKARGERWINR